MTRSLLAAIVLAAAVVPAGRGLAQSAPPDATPRPWLPPENTIVVNQPSDSTIDRGLLQFLVTHRFRDPVRGSNGHNWYSLNTGNDFGLGFSYAPANNVEVSLYRSALEDDYQLSAKYAIRPGGPGSLFGAALIAGGGDRRQQVDIDAAGNPTLADGARYSFFAQAVLGVHFWDDRVSIALVPSYDSNTGPERRVFNVPVHAAVSVTKSWNIQAEYVPPRRALDGSVAQWVIGVEKVLYRHRFTLYIGNSNSTTVGQMLSGDFALSEKRQQRLFDTGFRNNDWHIGFNLIRQFKIGGF